MSLDRKEYVDSLRAFANMLAQHPKVPLPSQGGVNGEVTWFIHKDIADAVAVRDRLIEVRVERSGGHAFPVVIIGRLYGQPCRVYVARDIALTNPLPLPGINPLLEGL